MSRLLIRYTAGDGQLRSVGDPPNGILAVSLWDGAHFVVNSKVEPPSPKGSDLVVHYGGQGEHDASEPVSIEDVVAGAVTDTTAKMLWMAMVMALETVVQTRLPKMAIEEIEDTAAFARLVRDELERAGHLARFGEDPPERNDPCWCDSGKKYKKCHGA